MSSHLFLAAVQAFGLMAICTIGYGYIQRSIRSAYTRDCVIGLMLGLGSACSMLQPYTVVEGYQIDGRSMFLAISTAFGGILPTIIAATIACLARIAIGGAGVALGVTTILLVCGLAAVWTWATRTDTKRSWATWIVLGAIVSMPLLLSMMVLNLILPAVALMRIGTDTVSALVFGKMFEGELRRGHRERQLDMDASTDPLTGLPNRRAMMAFLDHLSEAERARMALLIIDADHFKSINDTHGHDVGDAVLKAIADSLSASIREGDFAARFGGEEFAVLMQMPGQSDGYPVADRIRHALSGQRVIGDHKITVTVSVGGTRLPPGVFDFAKAYAKADAALYNAKRQGRDRTVFA